MKNFLRLGNAGLQGVVGHGLGLSQAMNYCSALATWNEGGKIVIASDPRYSTPMLKSAAISAFLAAGCDVIDAGIAPAPLLHYLVPKLGAGAGCLISAGHHDQGWNAIQSLNEEGSFFSDSQCQELLDIYHSRQFELKKWDEIGQLSEITSDQIHPYIEEICSDIDVDAIRAANFKVVIDSCNGSASTITGALCEYLNLEAIQINDELNGYLPHAPEPRPRTAYQVKTVLEVVKADIGFVLSSDASRVSIVSSCGETLSEEYTFPLVAQALLAQKEGDLTVVTNCCTTRTLDEVVEQNKAKLIKTKVGQSAAIQAMIANEAVLAGDGSGSVAFADTVKGFDALKVIPVILGAMAQRKLSSAELVEELPRKSIKKRRVPCSPLHGYNALSRLREHYKGATIDETDGLRFDWPDGWVHARLSNTEPVIRVVSEWKTEKEARDLANKTARLLSHA